MTTKKKHQFRFPLWAKALTVLILSVFIVGGTAITFFSYSISSITRNHYVEHSVELADTLALYLNLDDVKVVKNKVDEIYKSIPEDQKIENSYWGEPEWEEYLAKYDEVVEMPEYKSLFSQIEVFHEKNHARFISIGYADMENARFVYLVDDAEIEERCLPGSFDDFTDNDMAIYDNPKEGFPPEITNMPEYGYLASVARPIFDESNEIVGFAMVDLSMDEILIKEQGNIRTLSIIILSLSIGTVLVGSLLVLFLIARPVRKLTKAANEYTKGEDQELNKFAKVIIKTKDEIEDLSISMKKMEKDINDYIVNLLGAERKADELKQLSEIDALTGMYNKRPYFEMEEKLNKQIKEKKAKFAVTMIDMNDLKIINDTLGHEKGDEAIVTLAEAIKATYQKSICYRIGGDEFVVVSENEDLDNIEHLAEELVKNLAIRSKNITVATGISVFDAKTDNNFEDTFKRADHTMYEHKKTMKSK